MNTTRKSILELTIDGTDISKTINEDLISLRYIDAEEDEADDLQLTLHDRDGRWMNKWLDDAVIAQLNTDDAVQKTKGLAIVANIVCTNWTKPGATMKLECGKFELDSITASGPPANINIKASSLFDKNGLRTTNRSKSWEYYTLAGVGKEIASRAGLGFIFDSGYDPGFPQKEQNEQTDIAFLKRLCNDAGCSLKISHGKIIIFDQSKYENHPSVAVITKGDGSYSSYNLRSSSSDTKYTNCILRYLNPATGKLIQGEARTEDYEEDGDHRALVVSSQRVANQKEAEILADKLLRMKNKFEKAGRFNMIGNPSLVASEVIELAGWGAFNGRYIIKRTTHNVSSSGYTTIVELRNVL